MKLKIFSCCFPEGMNKERKIWLIQSLFDKEIHTHTNIHTEIVTRTKAEIDM